MQINLITQIPKRMNNFATIYSHDLIFDQVTALAKQHFPKANISASNDQGRQLLSIDIKGGLFKSAKQIKISYRQRNKPSYQIAEIDSPLTQNLQGMLGFINSLPASNEELKRLLMVKVGTVNSETAILHDGKLTKQVAGFTQQLSKQSKAIVFVAPDSPIARSQGQHFLDQDLNLLLDTGGQSEVGHLNVEINAQYHDAPQENLSEAQTNRKAKNEAFLESKGINVNKHLPAKDADDQIQIRTPKEIATRVTTLAVTNYVAFSSISGEQGMGFFKKFNLESALTPKEINFLKNPTDELKNIETWKCEGIWVLLWALNIVDDLPYPNALCDLKLVDPEKYPVNGNQDPNTFIQQFNSTRSKAEIIDAFDLYYRMYWACVDQRIKGQQMSEVHPSVVFERLYALNWLTNYKGQDWDNITCDT